MSKFKSKTLWVLVASLALVLVLALGCGASSGSGQGAAQAADTTELPAMGSQVGDRIHPFTMRLLDGTTVTSAGLASQERPTFLLYFKHP